jgi:hypothetical protein
LICAKEHEDTFSEYKGSSLTLKYFVTINSPDLSRAETLLKKKVGKMDIKFELENFTELIAVSKDTLHELSKTYVEVNDVYGGKNKNMNVRVHEIQQDCEIQVLKSEEKISDIKNKLLESKTKNLELRLENKEQQLKIKELEQQLKSQIKSHIKSSEKNNSESDSDDD